MVGGGGGGGAAAGRQRTIPSSLGSGGTATVERSVTPFMVRGVPGLRGGVVVVAATGAGTVAATGAGAVVATGAGAVVAAATRGQVTRTGTGKPVDSADHAWEGSGGPLNIPSALATDIHDNYL